MKLNLIDKSNYLKGILILIGKDRSISKQETSLFTALGQKLGFDPEFCRVAMNEFFENEFIKTDPPLFEDKLVARAFLRDGFFISALNNEPDNRELNWLKSVAEKNGIPFEIDELRREKVRMNQDQIYFEVGQFL